MPLSSDVDVSTVLTRRRTKLNNPENNISIFQLPYTNEKL